MDYSPPPSATSHALSRRLDLVLLLHAQPRGREGGDVLAVHRVVELLDRADDLLPLLVRVRVLVLVVLDAEQVLGAEQHVVERRVVLSRASSVGGPRFFVKPCRKLAASVVGVSDSAASGNDAHSRSSSERNCISASRGSSQLVPLESPKEEDTCWIEVAQTEV